MTLIFSLLIENVPLLVGDILVSSGLPNRKIPFIPSIGERINNFNFDQSFYFVNTFQKIVLLDDHIAIACAGGKDPVKYLIERIIHKHNLNPFTRETLTDFFRTDLVFKVPILQNDDWSIIVFIYSSINNSVKVFRKGVFTLNNPTFGRINYAGSGTRVFESLLSNLPIIEKGEEDLFINELPQGMTKALFSALLLMGDLWKLDFHENPESLKNRFGGGYEIAFLSEGKFKKFTDYLILVWVIDSNNNFSTHIAVKSYYHEDLLIIRVLEGDGRDFTRNRGYVVKTLLNQNQSVNLDNIKKVDLNSHYLLNYFLTLDIDGKGKEQLVAIFHQPNMNEFIEVTELEDETQIFIKPKELLINKINSILKKKKVI
jgi:hypothetical protein